MISLIALVLAVGVGGPEMDLAGSSPLVRQPSGIDSWTSSGSTAWAGMPTPTVDCVAGASGGALKCTGATVTPSGSPTTVQSPWYPSGFAASPMNAVALNGTSQYYDFGVFDDTANTWTVCLTFETNNLTGNHDLFTHSGSSHWWQIYSNGGNLTGALWDGTSAAAVANYALSTGAANVGCWSFNGTVLYQNVNGAFASTGYAHSPADNTAHLQIGHGAGDLTWAGWVSRATIWQTTAATQAQLLAAVQSQLSLLARKPANGAITFTSDGGFCWDSTLSLGWWLPANAPCVTSAGMFVGGQSQNLALQSQTLATGAAATSPWATANATAAAPTLTGTADPDPNGVASMATRIAFPSIAGAGQYSLMQQPVTTTAAAWVASAFLKSTSGSGTVYLSLNNGSSTEYLTACAVNASTYTRCWATGTATAATWYVSIGPDGRAWSSQPTTQGALTVDVTYVQVEPGYSPTLYHATTSSPYSGIPTSASVAQVAGATYYEANQGSWTIIPSDPIPIANGTQTLAQCAGQHCKKP